jgi:predicted 3-demethylubiquinone-9 3-methyltransferase (glyoxalase superfamily)
MPKITPFLWFNDQAEQAARFYTSIFKKSKIKDIARYGKAGSKVARRAKGSVMTVSFELDGQEFTALNGGPLFKFTEAISFVIRKDQKELDHFWSRLSAGGEPGQCGWLKDKYGVSWQVVPTVLFDLLSGRNSERVMQAMLQMKKMDIKKLKEAAAQVAH